MKNYILILIVFRSLSVFGQTESVHLHLDKSIAYPGDTVWFRGYIFDANHVSKRSTNLYVELYNSDGKLQSRSLFPIANGLSYGQVAAPGGAGLYWIRSYTRNSGFFLSSLTVRGKDQKLITRTLIRNIEKPVKSVPVNMLLDNGTCTINIDDAQPCTYSLAIVNSNAVGPAPTILNAFGSDKIQAFNIHTDPQVYPEFKIPEPATYRLDTVNQLLQRVKIKAKNAKSDGAKELDKQYTSGRFRWPGRYSYNLMDTSHYDPKVITNILLYLNREMPIFKYNEMNESTLPTYKNKYVTFYLDEQLINYKDLLLMPITDLAYVKVIEEATDDDKNTRGRSDIPDDPHHRISDTLTANFGADNSPAAMICVYRRKGKDLQHMASNNVKTMPLKGYDISAKWTKPDNSTLLWMPFIKDKKYTFNLPNESLNGSYKLILEGVDADGGVFYFEHDLK